MNDELEKLAKELADKFYSISPEELYPLSKYIHKKIIEANLIQLNIIKDIPGKNLYIIDELYKLQDLYLRG